MNILAINPWIYDFAAYDFWLKPYGFLVILSYLKKKGYKIDYIDCMEKKITAQTFGRGKYYSEPIEKPQIFKDILRYFKRYGIPIEELEKKIKNKNPDYILITSSMTYWYPAIVDLTKILKERFPKIPIILGGTYATLCHSHAKKISGCDYVFKNGQEKEFFKLLKTDYDPNELYNTLPNYANFYKKLDYLVFRTSWGCPFSCSYCAIKELFKDFFRIPHEKIIKYIQKYAKKSIKDFILYDDAFLYEPDYAKALLKGIIDLKLNINFHTPNALHLRYLDKEITTLLKKANFINPHFGLETMDTKLQKTWGDKVTKEEVIRGIELLKAGGFNIGEFSFYLLLGFPKQNLNKLKEEIDFLYSLGAKVSLAEFSPVPKTRLFKEYETDFKEPLMQNNSVFGSFQNKKIKEFWEIKNYLRESNKKITDSTN